MAKPQREIEPDVLTPWGLLVLHTVWRIDARRDGERALVTLYDAMIDLDIKEGLRKPSPEIHKKEFYS